MVAVFKENFVDTKVSNVNALKKKDNHIKKLDNLANDFKNNVIKMIQNMHKFDITKFTRYEDNRKYNKMNNSIKNEILDNKKQRFQLETNNYV